MNGNNPERDRLAVRLEQIAASAGAIVLEARACDINVRAKPDGTPCSDADLRSQDAIMAALNIDFPDTPVISEESDWLTLRETQGAFFLVDPLDGTSDYISGGKEFCINIALIENNRAVAGVILAPALGLSWLGGEHAHKREHGYGNDQNLRRIMVRTAPEGGLTALVSLRHADQLSEDFLKQLPIQQRDSVSSAIKFGLIAEGRADVYPRFAPTMAWDTAAGQIILEAAGGCVLDTKGNPLVYRAHASGLLNAGFSAWGDPQAARPAISQIAQRQTS
jgi:3'(2'), 5'-bisphosphate nucleotidase